MKISKEDKIRIIIEDLEEIITIPTNKEDQVKDVLRKSLRTIEDKENEEI